MERPQLARQNGYFKTKSEYPYSQPGEVGHGLPRRKHECGGACDPFLEVMLAPLPEDQGFHYRPHTTVTIQHQLLPAMSCLKQGS